MPPAVIGGACFIMRWPKDEELVMEAELSPCGCDTGRRNGILVPCDGGRMTVPTTDVSAAVARESRVAVEDVVI